MKNGRYWILILIGIIISGLLIIGFTKYWGMQKVEVKEDKFSIYVPNEWTVEYADPSPEVDISGAFAYDNSKENFVFIVVSPSKTQDFKEDLAKWQKQFEIVDFQYINSEITKIDGREVATYDAITMNGETSYYQKGFITYENGNKYVVLAQCKDEEKDVMIKIFDKIFDTFKITK